MKYQLQCECCRMPIAAFDELKSPITYDQLKPYRPEAYLPRSFGGEFMRWDTFTCMRCGRWPFHTQELRNYKVVDGSITGKTEPERVRVAFRGFDDEDWYEVRKGQITCDKCGYSTEHRHIFARHEKSNCEWPKRDK